MTNQADLLAAVRANRDGHHAFLKELVEINSFSESKVGVDAVGDAVAAALEPLGLEHEVIRQEGIGDFHRFETSAAKQQPPLVLVGHLDTVFPADGGFLHFQETDTRFMGPGVLDMKGGISTIVFALKVLEPKLGGIPVRILLNSDEEVGSVTSAPWIRENVKDAAAALVFEAGRKDDAIVTCRKGSGRIRVTVTGRAAHAGNNHRDGANALVQLAHVITQLAVLTDYDRKLTVNVGRAGGGTARNVVPAQAWADAGFRFVEADDAERVQERVRQLVEATPLVEGTQTEIALNLSRPPMARTTGNVAIMRRYAELATQLGLASEEAPLQGGGSDANMIALEGIPVIDGLGPWGQGFHTHDEYIEIDSLERKTQALALLLDDWRARPGL